MKAISLKEVNFIEPEEKHFFLMEKLERETFSNFFNKSFISNIILKSAVALIVNVNKTYSGHIIANISSEELDILKIVIHPKFRRRGLGSKLLLNLLKHLELSSIKKILLEVAIDNKQALSFYSNLGFEKVGYRPSYYKNSNKDALILRLKPKILLKSLEKSI